MGGLHQRVIALAGWRRRGTAILFGCLAALALPPLYLVPFLVPAFVGLLWLIEGSPRPRAAFGAGWWFGLGHFTVGLYWIAIAFLTDTRGYDALGPAAVLGLAGVSALFPAAAALVTRLGPSHVLGRVLILAAAWTAFEWARSWVFTGFPWNLLGSVWAFSDSMIQVTALIGTYGLGLLTVTVATLPAILAEGRGRRSAVVLSVVIAIVVSVWGWGSTRLADAPADTVPDVRLRLVQPNIPQELKWVRELRGEHVLTQLRLTRSPAETPPTHVVWGETMVPFALSRVPEVSRAIGKATRPGGVTIVGAPRTTPAGERPYKVWNSLQAIDSQGSIVATYDKSHLVPVGEYVPLRGILPIAKMTAGATDFSAGPGPTTLDLPGLPPVSPLICYEVIFPGAVVNPNRRPAWILNLTNDSWYGRSSGPYQHFVASRLRAVEEGLPLVRVANGGISGVIDAYGRVQASLDLGSAGFLDADLPNPVAEPGGYARWGNGVVALLVTLFSVCGIILPSITARIRA